jgi:aspartyl-tRNA(Asn)/glutamyl-tRNA(Gln) amidotransferase subunit C
MRKISREEVLRIARLARLEFNDEEVEVLRHQLSSILDYIEKLKEINTEGVEPTFYTFVTETPLREDEEIKAEGADQLALREAPSVYKKFFRVPKVIK